MAAPISTPTSTALTTPMPNRLRMVASHRYHITVMSTAVVQYLDRFPGGDGAFRQDLSIHPALAGMLLLVDATRVSIEKRPPDRPAGGREARDPEHDLADPEERPRDNEGPVQPLDRQVLPGGPRADRMPFRRNPGDHLEREQADRRRRSAVPGIVMTIALESGAADLHPRYRPFRHPSPGHVDRPHDPLPAPRPLPDLSAGGLLTRRRPQPHLR